MKISDTALAELQSIILTERNVFVNLDEVKRIAESLIGLYSIILNDKENSQLVKKNM